MLAELACLLCIAQYSLFLLFNIQDALIVIEPFSILRCPVDRQVLKVYTQLCH